MVKIKRIYKDADKSDGYRILIDRLWPRGISKEKAKLDLWLKEIAPSNELRKWFGHDPEKWNEFRKRYAIEVKENKVSAKQLKEIIHKERTVTLLFAAADEQHNHALALKHTLHI